MRSLEIQLNSWCNDVDCHIDGTVTILVLRKFQENSFQKCIVESQLMVTNHLEPGNIMTYFRPYYSFLLTPVIIVVVNESLNRTL